MKMYTIKFTTSKINNTICIGPLYKEVLDLNKGVRKGMMGVISLGIKTATSGFQSSDQSKKQKKYDGVFFFVKISSFSFFLSRFLSFFGIIVIYII
jgi:hypothetical protein